MRILLRARALQIIIHNSINETYSVEKKEFFVFICLSFVNAVEGVFIILTDIQSHSNIILCHHM